MTTIDDLGDLRGRTVLVRSDLNVPLDGERITDDGRIRASLPTLRRLTEAGARVAVVAHLGRPKGAPDPAYSLRPVAARLGELLGAEVAFAEDTVGDSARATVCGLSDGQVAVLENVRFNAGETSKDEAEREAFARELAALADVFVSDGFGVVHRKQASVYDVARLLPHAMGGPGPHRDRGAAPADRGPRASLRGGAGRLQGLRQARRHRQPARQGRPAAHRGRDGLHLPRRAGPRGRQEPARAGPGRRVPRVPPPRGGVRRAADPAHRHRGGAGVLRRRSRHGRARPTRSPTTSSGSTSDRTRSGPSPRRWPTRGRSSGTARWASSSSRPSPRAPARWPRR